VLVDRFAAQNNLARELSAQQLTHWLKGIDLARVGRSKPQTGTLHKDVLDALHPDDLIDRSTELWLMHPGSTRLRLVAPGQPNDTTAFAHPLGRGSVRTLSAPAMAARMLDGHQLGAEAPEATSPALMDLLFHLDRAGKCQSAATLWFSVGTATRPFQELAQQNTLHVQVAGTQRLHFTLADDPVSGDPSMAEAVDVLVVERGDVVHWPASLQCQPLPLDRLSLSLEIELATAPEPPAEALQWLATRAPRRLEQLRSSLAALQAENLDDATATLRAPGGLFSTTGEPATPVIAGWRFPPSHEELLCELANGQPVALGGSDLQIAQSLLGAGVVNISTAGAS
jgi:hypothetical protein